MKHPRYGNTHHIPLILLSKEVQGNAIGTTMVCFLWILLLVVAVNVGLWCIGEVTTGCSSQNVGVDVRDDVKLAR